MTEQANVSIMMSPELVSILDKGWSSPVQIMLITHGDHYEMVCKTLEVDPGGECYRIPLSYPLGDPVTPVVPEGLPK